MGGQLRLVQTSEGRTPTHRPTPRAHLRVATERRTAKEAAPARARATSTGSRDAIVMAETLCAPPGWIGAGAHTHADDYLPSWQKESSTACGPCRLVYVCSYVSYRTVCAYCTVHPLIASQGAVTRPQLLFLFGMGQS